MESRAIDNVLILYIFIKCRCKCYLQVILCLSTKTFHQDDAVCDCCYPSISCLLVVSNLRWKPVSFLLDLDLDLIEGWLTRSTGGWLQSSLKTMENATSLVTSDNLEKKFWCDLSRASSYLFASLVLLLILLKMSVLKPSRTSLMSRISYLSDPEEMTHQQILSDRKDFQLQLCFKKSREYVSF